MRKYNLKAWMKMKLRNISMMWPEKNIAKGNFRVERGKYKCADCEDEILHGPKDIKLDHIKAVIPTEDYTKIMKRLKKDKEFLDLLAIEEGDFEEMFEIVIMFSRMFCKASGYQVLCDEHHDIKSNLERELRKGE